MPDSKINNEPHHFAGLEILRAIAALAVMAFHFTALGQFNGNYPAWVLPFTYGGFGVDLFFVIGGFVITRSALSLKATGASNWGRVFWARRIARLMPLYLFSCAIWLLLIDRTPLINGNAWQQIGAYVFMLQHWFDATRGSINPVTWTLSVEVHHYLMVFLAVMLLLPNMQQRRWLVAALICGVLYSVAFRYGVFVRFPDEAGKVRWTLIASGMFDAFAIGGLIAVAHQAGTLERLHRHQSLLWCVWIVLATILIAAIHSAGMNASGQRDGAAYWASAWFAVGFRFALACVCGLLLVLMLQFRATGAVARALVYLGAISYGIYLWHFFALKLLDRYQLGGAVAAVVGVAATLMVAHLSYRFIETPVNQWTRRRALLVR